MKIFVVFCAFLALSQAISLTGFKKVVVNRDGSITEEQVMEGIVGNKMVKELEIVNENVDVDGVKQQGVWKKQISPINTEIANQVLASRVPITIEDNGQAQRQMKIELALEKSAFKQQLASEESQTARNNELLNQFQQIRNLPVWAQKQLLKNIGTQIIIYQVLNNQVLAGRTPNTIEAISEAQQLARLLALNRQTQFERNIAMLNQYQQIKNLPVLMQKKLLKNIETEVLKNQLNNNQVFAGRTPNNIEAVVEVQRLTMEQQVAFNQQSISNQKSTLNQQSQSARNNALLNQFQQIKNLPVWEQRQLLKKVDVQILVNQIRNNQVFAGLTPNIIVSVIKAQQVAQQLSLKRQTQSANNKAMLNQFQQINNLPVWENQLLKNIKTKALGNQISNNQAFPPRVSNTIEQLLENQLQQNSQLQTNQQLPFVNRQTPFARNNVFLNQNQHPKTHSGNIKNFLKKIASAIKSSRIQKASQQPTV